MKTLLTILLLMCAAELAAQYDTTHYSQVDLLSKKIDNMQYNLGMYAKQRDIAFGFMGASIASSLAVYGVNSMIDYPQAALYAIPAGFSVIAVIKLIGAEKYLRKAGVEVTARGVIVKF